MKVGLSTYSLFRALKKSEIDIIEAIVWIADNGGEHVEIVPFGFELTGNLGLVAAIVDQAKAVGLEISSYTVPGNLLQDTPDDCAAEIERLKREVDIAHALGVKLMRHDIAKRHPEESTLENFEKDLPILAQGCRVIADYAGQYGITTSIENHGYHVQSSERVQSVIRAVDRENFKTTMDIGNFVFVDEDALAAVRNNIPLASMVHAKDFYIRDEDGPPGEEGWYRSRNGKYLRGAIVGQGDLDIREILKSVKDFGYDGFIAVEFEGMEDCFYGSRIGMDNLRRIWNEV